MNSVSLSKYNILSANAAMRVRLLGYSALACLAAASAPGWAQTATPQNPDEQNVEQAADIIVTGSRIKRPELSSPTPLSSMNSEELASKGQTNVEEMVSQIPSLVGSSSSADNSQGSLVGVNFLNLRNLGTSRTLVLINGRRQVGADPLGSAAVDTNTIPADLVERVEVTTGGASAVYGADGVSGVVNFVMKRDFTGLKATAQGGISTYGDLGNYYGSLIGGKNFTGGRGNVTLAYEYNRQNGITAVDRDYLSTDMLWFMNNPAGPAAKPASILLGNIRDVLVAADGMIDPSGAAIGGPFRGHERLNPGNNVGSPGAGVPSATIGGNGTELWRIINWGVIPESERHTANLMTHFEFSPAVKFYGELKYSRTRSSSVQQSTFTIFSRVFNDNPFLPALAKAAATAVGAGNPDGSGIQIPYTRFDIDSGGRWVKRLGETWRAVGGFEGDITDNLSYNTSLVYGQTTTTLNRQLRLDDRYFAASDVVIDPATGKPACRSTLNPAAFANTPVDVLTAFNPAGGAKSFTPGANSGCVPLNAFIDDPAANKKAHDWIYTTAPIRGRLTQVVLNGYVNGNSNLLGFALPGGPVEFVVGGEYRKETARTDFPALIETGPVFVYDRGSKDQKGQFDVSEVFTEMSLPIVKDGGTLLHEVTIDGAYRYSKYSTIGSTNTWSVRGLWAPIRDVRFRATLSRAIRAPNINELFGANQPQNFLPVDPCSVNNLGLGSATRRANCTAALAKLGLTPTLSLPSTAVNFIGSTGGNPGLGAETAKTLTYGAVFQPSFIPGLEFTIDYWRIRMSNGVISPGAQDIVNSCYDAATLDNPFCPLLGRGANGDINDLSVKQLNVASFVTSGIDFGVSYRKTIGDLGTFHFDIDGTYLRKLALQGTVNPKLDDERGEGGLTGGGTLLGGPAPKWVMNFSLGWKRGDFGLQYGLNYFSRLLRVENDTTLPPGDLQLPYKNSALWNHSVRMSYDVNDRYKFYAGVRNIGNQKPDPNAYTLPIDATGRYYFAGVTVALD